MSLDESSYPVCPFCEGRHEPVISVAYCPPALAATPEPTLESCTYCKGMHPLGTVELCPLKPLEFLPWLVPSAVRRMDESIATALLAFDLGEAMLQLLQPLYTRAYGKEVLAEGHDFNLQADIKMVEALRQKLEGLKQRAISEMGMNSPFDILIDLASQWGFTVEIVDGSLVSEPSLPMFDEQKFTASLYGIEQAIQFIRPRNSRYRFTFEMEGEDHES